MESTATERGNCGDVSKMSSKNLQTRLSLSGHCIICLRKVSLIGKRSHCKTRESFRVDRLESTPPPPPPPPEIAPKSAVSSAGFLLTFNQIWAVLQNNWKKKNETRKEGKGLSQEIGISLENCLQSGCGSTNVSFSKAPTFCQLCCDKVVAVENLMKAVRQQCREISILLEEGRRRQDGGNGDFEKSLRENGEEESVIKATLEFVGIFGSRFSEENFKVEQKDNESDTTKMDFNEESLATSDDDEDHSEGQLGELGNDGDPDYIKSEEELEDDHDDLDESECEMDVDDKNDPNYIQEKDPLTVVPNKRRKDNSVPEKLASQFTSSKQKKTNQSNYKFCCNCGRRFLILKKLREHVAQNKDEVDPKCGISEDIKSHRRQGCELCGEKIMFRDIRQHLTEHLNGQAEWVIKCPNEKCRHMFASTNALHLHLKTKIKTCKKIWLEIGGPVCETCGFKGTNMLKIRHHLRNNHENKRENRNIKCPISDCGKMFCTKQGVNFHVYEHRYRPITQQICDKCGESLKVEEMEGHLKDKHGILEVIGCKQCEMKFSGRDEMVEHLYEHRGLGIICDICGEDKFDRYVDFREHYFLAHKLCPKKYKCGEGDCEIWFWRKETKEEHTLKMHKESNLRVRYKKLLVGEGGKRKKEFGCDLCNVKFVAEDILTSHQIKFHGADPFSCDNCGKTFHVKRLLNKHMKEHGGIVFQKEWKCEVEGCGRIFKNKYRWQHHNEVGHGGVKPHVCDICGKSYCNAGGLKSHHDSVHLGLRPWICDECGEGFTSVTVLKRHQLIHTGERPFACEICGQRFRHKNVLETHLKGHEKKGAEFKPNGPMKQIRKRKAQ